MIHDNIILFMNQNTYMDYLRQIREIASAQKDPIEYIVMVADIKVVIDNSLDDDIVEVWDDEGKYFNLK